MMPKVIGNDSLIARVNEVQGCMYRQSNELGRLNRAVKKYKDENAKLRELVRDMFEEIEAGGFDPMVERHGKSTVYYEEDPSWRVEIRARVRELGVEVE